MGVVTIEDSTVYYGSNSTARSAEQMSTTILASTYVRTHVRTRVRTWYRLCYLYVDVLLELVSTAHVYVLLHLSACISSRF